MSKTAVKVIAIAYAIALMFAYVVRHPPGWMTSVAVTASGNRSMELFGHRFEMSVEITRSVPVSPPLSSPPRRVWLETPVTISWVPSDTPMAGPFPTVTYRTATDSAGGTTGADGR